MKNAIITFHVKIAIIIFFVLSEGEIHSNHA